MTKSKGEPKPSKTARSFIVIGMIVVVALVTLKFTRDRLREGRSTALDERSAVTAAADKPAQVNLKPLRDQAGARLIGRWLREDGGYVLEIREAASDGRLRTAYFNPSPIHVSKAAFVEEGGTLKVGVELNDVNYPGCLYTLVLDSELDQLVGQYYQAALGQTFPVVFIRMSVQ